MKKYPVIIVGAGPVGLCMAIALARLGIPSLTLNRDPHLSEHPRARGVSMRSMELLRLWGEIDELQKFEFPREAIRFIWAHSLKGKEITRIELNKSGPYTLGPLGASLITQDCVELYLKGTLEKFPDAQLQFSKEVLKVTEDSEGVTIEVRDCTTNQTEQFRTQYLVAADGSHSTVRKELEIEMKGPNDLGRFCNLLCEFDITQWTSDRLSIGYFFTDLDKLGKSLFLAYGKNRWIFGLRFAPEQTKEDFTDELCIAAIRNALEIPDLNIKIINKNFWTMAAQLATSYGTQRIFLVGDAAHRLPPTGGLGMNTGIQDAHNLAWKLAYVLKHQFSPKLLDTYFQERAPVARRNIDWSSVNAKRFVDIITAIREQNEELLKEKLLEQQQNLNYSGLDLGYIYHSDAISSENNQEISISPNDFIATTLPGIRAPYVKLLKDGEETSTLDLFEKDFVLLVGSNGQPWQEAAKQLALPLQVYRVAEDGDLVDPQNKWQEIYEITDTGAVLVRPDGHVAFRKQTMPKNPEQELVDYFAKIK